MEQRPIDPLHTPVVNNVTKYIGIVRITVYYRLTFLLLRISNYMDRRRLCVTITHTERDRTDNAEAARWHLCVAKIKTQERYYCGRALYSLAPRHTPSRSSD